MSSRERILITFVLPIIIAMGGVITAYLFVVKPLWEGDARIRSASDELDEKKGKLREEMNEEARLKKLDPRLTQWQRWSVPDSPTRAILDHNTRMQDEYVRYVSDLFSKNKLNLPKITRVTDPETTSAPTLANKLPLYTRFVFTIESEGPYEGFVKVLEEFQRTPLLHKISKLELIKPVTTGRPVAAVPAGAAPGGLGGPPAGGGRGGRPSTNLKINMTVEMIQVNGAEKRYTLFPYSTGAEFAFGPTQAILFTPPGTAKAPPVLATAGRIYTDMVSKNIFFGQPTINARLTSDHLDALRFNKLVCIKRQGYGRYDALLYDQRKALPTEAEAAAKLEERDDHRYMILRATKAVDYKLLDDYGNPILVLRIEDVTDQEVLFKILEASPAVKTLKEKMAFPTNKKLTTDRLLVSDDPQQVYRMRTSDFLTDALASRFNAKQTVENGK
jgi:hypothetical protein